jgi:hypothetical protein
MHDLSQAAHRFGQGGDCDIQCSRRLFELKPYNMRNQIQIDTHQSSAADAASTADNQWRAIGCRTRHTMSPQVV